jgi:hypothetical protein
VENSPVFVTFAVQDDRSEDLEVHCAIEVRDIRAFWSAKLCKASSIRGILEGWAVSVEAVRGHVQAEVLRQKIRARN